MCNMYASIWTQLVSNVCRKNLKHMSDKSLFDRKGSIRNLNLHFL